MPFILLEMVNQQLFKLPPPLTQDGGRCGTWMELTSQTRKERSLKLLDVEVQLVHRSWSLTRREPMYSANSGTSSMMMNIQDHQRRESSIKNLDSMLKDHSTLTHNCQATNISLLLTTEILSSRLSMDTSIKFGGSTKNP